MKALALIPWLASGLLLGLSVVGQAPEQEAPAPRHVAPRLTLEEHTAGWVAPDDWQRSEIPARAMTGSREVMGWDEAWRLNHNSSSADDVYVIGVR